MNRVEPLYEDRFLGPGNDLKQLALELYSLIKDAPLVCPHGHVEPAMFAQESYRFTSPTAMLILPDHYVFRMLYSQGVALEQLGIPGKEGVQVEHDHRRIWQIFADNFYLFRGTPTGIWIKHELSEVFGVSQPLSTQNAQEIYDQIDQCLQKPDFQPRRLFDRFNIKVLCTTDAASDSLIHHQTIRNSGWKGKIIPTFRPDAVVNLDTPGWRQNIEKLAEASAMDIPNFAAFIQALENRRMFFKSMGATATDHAALTAYTGALTPGELDAIFQKALNNSVSQDECTRFTGHMLMEMARMSIEDGLVMQIHVGALRNHNLDIYNRFGPEKGGDIPIATEFTRNLHPLLNKYGNDKRLTLILFSLDETPYARELAPLAGLYPAVKLGPPWWFNDSLNGMRRYFDQVMETAGIYNTAGFNDDTRAFPSIPARHDVWRRVSANWLADLILRRVVNMNEAADMMCNLATGLAEKAYRLNQ